MLYQLSYLTLSLEREKPVAGTTGLDMLAGSSLPAHRKGSNPINLAGGDDGI